MDDFNTLLTAISTVGFPIVVACIMIWYLNEERKSHAEEIDKLRETLAENTIAITKLKDFLEMSGGKK